MRKHNRPWLRFIEGAGDAPVPNADNGKDSSLSESQKSKNQDSDRGDTSDEGDEKESTGDTSTDKGANWADVFPEKTPAEVAADVAHWKKMSRKWERQSKENFEELEKARAKSEKATGADDTTARLTTLESQYAEANTELTMYRDLIALGQITGRQFEVAELTDSIGFRQAYAELDRSDDDYRDQLKALVTARTGHTEQKQPQREGYGTRTRNVGLELFERLNNKN